MNGDGVAASGKARGCKKFIVYDAKRSFFFVETDSSAKPRRTRSLLGGGVHGSTRGQTLLAARNLALASRLVLGAARLELVGDGLLASLLRLGPVDRLHEHTLVLEHVTLALQVHLVVHVLVNLLRLAVLLQQAAEHAVAAEPEHLGGQARLARTSALTVAGVATLLLRREVAQGARARVDLLGLADDETVLHELADVLARVGHADLADLWVRSAECEEGRAR